MTIKLDNFLRAKRFTQEFDFDEVAKQLIPKTTAGTAVGDAIASAISAIPAVPDATDTVKGKVALAVQANYPSTSDEEATTPAYVTAEIDAAISAIPAVPDASTTVTGLVNTSAQSFGGAKTFDTAVTAPNLIENSAAVALEDIDVQSAAVFTKTITAATTFTFSGAPAAGKALTFVLILTDGGSAVVTWPTSVKWDSGTAPTLTAAGVDVLGFLTIDGGTTWRGMVLSKDSK